MLRSRVVQSSVAMALMVACAGCGRLGYDAGAGHGLDGTPRSDGSIPQDGDPGMDDAAHADGGIHPVDALVPPGDAGVAGCGATCRKLAAGASHTCALRADGSLVCWGTNRQGQLCDGTTADRLTPELSRGSVLRVAARLDHTCVVDASGLVTCCGDNGYSQLGDALAGASNEGRPPGLGAVEEVGAELLGSCARTGDGLVYCWGIRRGSPSTIESGPEPRVVAGFEDAMFLAVGFRHGCVIRASGTVSCWGDNYAGQLGDGTMTWRADAAEVSGTSGTTWLSGGYFHTCSVSAGEVWCWGGSPASSLTPARVDGLTAIVRVESGDGFACALDGAGGAWCWGTNGQGQLGDGTTTSRATPVPLAVPVPLVDLALGTQHGCGATAAGEVWCWGRNMAGQVGDGTTIGRPTPVRVLGPE